ncbi:MAG: cyclic-di-AMP-binding protein CbpB [Bacillaceae bacterium]
MISLNPDDIEKLTINQLMIPAEKVAHVQVKNSLEHALLVLIRSGYSAIPVLDHEYHLHGLISTTMVMDCILGLERIEFERLSELLVEEAMNKDIPRLRTDDYIQKGIDLMVDHPFVCVENEDGLFEGIFTRRAILKELNRSIRKYNVRKKPPILDEIEE